ncbi:MAG: GMC family oxidoreductase, partial [Chloroflexi bacterium]
MSANSQDPGTRERVWRSPWRSQVPFPGLAYCVGGRSLYWGGWSPRLTAADLSRWPADIATFLQAAPGSFDGYQQVEKEIGVWDKTDYISGPLFAELKTKMVGVKGSVPTVDDIEDAPLAVQASPPASGLFSFDKYSSAPILIDAIREASGAPDWRRRLFLVPRAHVIRLSTSGGVVNQIEVDANGQRKFLTIDPTCAVVLANGTIEATRLALESFPTPLMGRNLMAHLRSNTIVRIKRAAFAPSLPKQLEAAALLVRGSTPQGRYHLQVTAAAVLGPNSEKDMFQMIPDVELLDSTLASQDADWSGNPDPTQPKATGAPPSWIDLSPDQTDEFSMRRAWVNLVKSANEDLLWRAMDDAAIALAQKLAGAPSNIQYFYNKDASLNAPGATWHADPPPPSTSNNRDDPANKVRDGLGTTHHEAGTLWMGTDPNTSVTNLTGRFHRIANAYAAGPAVFPTLGSANPSLTALSLSRRTALAITSRLLDVESDFTTIGSGGLRDWQMAGSGGFIELGANIIESVD